MTALHVALPHLGRGAARLRQGLSLGLLLASVACSGTDDRAPVTGKSGLRTSVTEQAFPCSEGEVRECSVFIKERSGVVTCAPGIRICDSGRFSECEIEGSGQLEGSAGETSEG